MRSHNSSSQTDAPFTPFILARELKKTKGVFCRGNKFLLRKVNNFSSCAKAKAYLKLCAQHAPADDGLKNIVVRRKIVINDERNNEAERTTRCRDYYPSVCTITPLGGACRPAAYACGCLPICVYARSSPPNRQGKERSDTAQLYLLNKLYVTEKAINACF